MTGPKIAAGTTEQELADARAYATAVTATMPLAALRKAHALTQQQMADELGMTQGHVSELENRTDLLLSTMRRFIEATGGTLELVAHYPKGDVIIEHVAAMGEPIIDKPKVTAPATRPGR